MQIIPQIKRVRMQLRSPGLREPVLEDKSKRKLEKKRGRQGVEVVGEKGQEKNPHGLGKY